MGYSEFYKIVYSYLNKEIHIIKTNSCECSDYLSEGSVELSSERFFDYWDAVKLLEKKVKDVKVPNLIKEAISAYLEDIQSDTIENCLD